MGRGRQAGILAGLAAAAACAGMALAQMDEGSARRLTLSYGATLRVDDNFALDTTSAGTSTFLTPTVGLEYVTETRTQSFALGLSGLVRLADGPGSTTVDGFDEPRLSFAYTREAARARLALEGSYTESKVAFLRLADDIGEELDPTDLVTDRGSRALTRLGGELELGTGGPLVTTFTLDHARRDYTGTTDPELFDTRDTTAAVRMRLAFSPVLAGRVQASLREYDAADAVSTERQTRRIGFGLEGDLRRDLRFDLSLEHVRIETVQTGGTTLSSGLSGDLLVTRDLPDGSLWGKLSNDYSVNGNRYGLRLGRTLELPRGSLAFDLGAVRQEGVSRTYLVGTLAYVLADEDDRFTASLARNVTTSSNENVVALTRGTFGYRRQVSELSGLGITLTLADSRQIAGPVASTDRKRASLQVTYDRQLTRDWTLTGGVEHRYLDTRGVGSARSNAVFLTLNRRLELLP